MTILYLSVTFNKYLTENANNEQRNANVCKNDTQNTQTGWTTLRPGKFLVGSYKNRASFGGQTFKHKPVDLKLLSKHLQLCFAPIPTTSAALVGELMTWIG